MSGLKKALYPLIGIPVFIILVWYIAVPTELVREKIEYAISNAGNANINLSVRGLKKNILPGLHADAVDIIVNKKRAVSIENIAFDFSPAHLFSGQLAFAVSGNVANGDIHGLFMVPVKGDIKIEHAELSAVPYLTQFGLDINGNVFSDINLDEDILNVKFEVPDLRIGNDTSIIPLLNTFRQLRGAVYVQGNTVHVKSVTLEGDKGYARLKGDIINGVSDMSLELMPDMEKLKAMESMVIGKYIVSPGYYVVPLKGRMP